jgi:hypothetical protein
MHDDEDAPYRDAAGRIDPFKFALKGSRPASREQMIQAGLRTPGIGHGSAEENNCEQDEGA